MELTICAGTGVSSDEVRSLYRWIRDDDMIDGHLRPLEGHRAPNTLGSALDTLVVAVAPGGAITALIIGTISWLRHRNGDVTLRIQKNGTDLVELSARRVRGLASEDVTKLVNELTKVLEEPSQ